MAIVTDTSLWLEELITLGPAYGLATDGKAAAEAPEEAGRVTADTIPEGILLAAETIAPEGIAPDGTALDEIAPTIDNIVSKTIYVYYNICIKLTTSCQGRSSRHCCWINDRSFRDNSW